jgi:uncharacterized membrane protein
VDHHHHVRDEVTALLHYYALHAHSVELPSTDLFGYVVHFFTVGVVALSWDYAGDRHIQRSKRSLRIILPALGGGLLPD